MSKIKEIIEVHADGAKSIFVNDKGEVVTAAGLNLIEENCDFCEESCQNDWCPTKDEE